MYVHTPSLILPDPLPTTKGSGLGTFVYLTCSAVM